VDAPIVKHFGELRKKAVVQERIRRKLDDLEKQVLESRDQKQLAPALAKAKELYSEADRSLVPKLFPSTEIKNRKRSAKCLVSDIRKRRRRPFLILFLVLATVSAGASLVLNRPPSAGQGGDGQHSPAWVAVNSFTQAPSEESWSTMVALVTQRGDFSVSDLPEEAARAFTEAYRPYVLCKEALADLESDASRKHWQALAEALAPYRGECPPFEPDFVRSCREELLEPYLLSMGRISGHRTKATDSSEAEVHSQLAQANDRQALTQLAAIADRIGDTGSLCVIQQRLSDLLVGDVEEAWRALQADPGLNSWTALEDSLAPFISAGAGAPAQVVTIRETIYFPYLASMSEILGEELKCVTFSQADYYAKLSDSHSEDALNILASIYRKIGDMTNLEIVRSRLVYVWAGNVEEAWHDLLKDPAPQSWVKLESALEPFLKKRALHETADVQRIRSDIYLPYIALMGKIFGEPVKAEDVHRDVLMPLLRTATDREALRSLAMLYVKVDDRAALMTIRKRLSEIANDCVEQAWRTLKADPTRVNWQQLEQSLLPYVREKDPFQSTPAVQQVRSVHGRFLEAVSEVTGTTVTSVAFDWDGFFRGLAVTESRHALLFLNAVYQQVNDERGLKAVNSRLIELEEGTEHTTAGDMLPGEMKLVEDSLGFYYRHWQAERLSRALLTYERYRSLPGFDEETHAEYVLKLKQLVRADEKMDACSRDYTRAVGADSRDLWQTAQETCGTARTAIGDISGKAADEKRSVLAKMAQDCATALRRIGSPTSSLEQPVRELPDGWLHSQTAPSWDYQIDSRNRSVRLRVGTAAKLADGYTWRFEWGDGTPPSPRFGKLLHGEILSRGHRYRSRGGNTYTIIAGCRGKDGNQIGEDEQITISFKQ